MTDLCDRLEKIVLERLRSGDGKLLVVGICGAQGSGKSTVSDQLAKALSDREIATAVLSIDDLYLGKQARLDLAQALHPLFATRGVPGTHDVALGLSVISALEQGGAVQLPRFDKAVDDVAPQADWRLAPSDTRVLLLEGWCVGARPEEPAGLELPVNQLEATEDADGRWRRHVNESLAGVYQTLFGRLDLLVLLQAPGFEVVQGWRLEQEHALRARTGGGMADAELHRFISHYERLTRHILSEMPERADLVAVLNSDRSVASFINRTG